MSEDDARGMTSEPRRVRAPAGRRSDLVHERLRADVLEGRLAPGDAVPSERALADELGKRIEESFSRNDDAAAFTALAELRSLAKDSVTAEVDETDVLLVKAGTKAVVEVDAVPDAQYVATVRAVDLSPTSSAGGGVSYRVRLALGAGTLAGGGAAPRPRPRRQRPYVLPRRAPY